MQFSITFYQRATDHLSSDELILFFYFQTPQT